MSAPGPEIRPGKRCKTRSVGLPLAAARALSASR
jgi:hypothetical protein